MWFRRSADPFALLGCVLENFMELETQSGDWLKRREKVTRALAKYGRSYGHARHIVGRPRGHRRRSLDAIIETGNLPRGEFDRALKNVAPDPPAAVTAACAIVEPRTQTGSPVPDETGLRSFVFREAFP